MEPFEVQGEWWLPHAPDRRVPGRLKVDPIEGSTLELIGGLREWHELGVALPGGRGIAVGGDNDQSGSYPRILGVADDDDFTLEDCFQTSLTERFGRHADQETIYANQVLRGAHFDANAALEATGVRIMARHLASWVGESGLTEHLPSADETHGDARLAWRSVAAVRIPDRSAQLSDDRRFTLGQVLGTDGDGLYTQSLTQDFFFRLDSSRPEPLVALVKRASAFQTLVTIAVNTRAQFESVEFLVDFPDAQPGTPSMCVPVDYFVPWRGADDPKSKSPLRRRSMLCTLADIGGIPGIEQWLRSAEVHRTGLTRVVESDFSQSMYVHDRVLSIAAALESFDRETNPKRESFHKRIERCACTCRPAILGSGR